VVVLEQPRTVRHGKLDGLGTGRTVRANAPMVRPCLGALICQAGTTMVVFILDMSSSIYNIMVGAANPHLLPMYHVTSFKCWKTRSNIFLQRTC
jgi:hypothetical protein